MEAAIRADPDRDAAVARIRADLRHVLGTALGIEAFPEPGAA